MSERIWPRLGAASGLLYVAVLAGGSLFGGDTGKRVELVALLFFLPFVAYLCSVLRRAEGAPGWLSTTALAAGLVSITVKFASAAPLLVARNEPDGTRLHEALVAVNDTSFILTMLPLGLLAGVVAIVTLRTRSLPRWFGWFAGAVAPTLVVNGLFFDSVDGPAMLLFLLWVLAATAVLVREAGTALEAVSATASVRPEVA
jgi:hypothetical protein